MTNNYIEKTRPRNITSRPNIKKRNNSNQSLKKHQQKHTSKNRVNRRNLRNTHIWHRNRIRTWNAKTDSKKPSTTHADEGGTGMGFMNTFDTLKKYKASMEIREIGKPSKDNYTKIIIIKFDQKNEFKISSYRQQEIGQIETTI